MTIRAFTVRLLSVIAFAVFCDQPAHAVRPTEELLSKHTKLHISVPDIDLLINSWNETQLGKLVQDPLMGAFATDIQQQLKEGLSQTGSRLGLTWADLDGVYGGEACVAMVQPGGDKKAHAIVMLVDVTDHQVEAEALLLKVEKDLIEKRSAKKGTLSFGQTQVTVLSWIEDKQKKQSYSFIKDNQLVLTDHEKVAADIEARVSNESDDALSKLSSFIEIKNKCRQEENKGPAHIQWYIDPFGYASILLADQTRPPKILDILKTQGFDAIQALGGSVSFATEKHELIHRSMIYAPPVEKTGEKEEKYQLAARMLNFFNQGSHVPNHWIPETASSYFSFNWKMKDAFYHSKTLVNAFLDPENQEDMFNIMFDGIRDDEFGPQIDLRTELADHLSDQAMIVSDIRLPVKPNSERMLVAVKLANEKLVEKTINKLYETDPQAEPHKFKGHTIWVMVSEPEEELKLVTVDGLDSLDEEFAVEEDQAQANSLLENSAITVAFGYLLVASDLEYLKSILNEDIESDSLEKSADYQRISSDLQTLGAGNDAFRMFSRTDKTYRPTYELIRQGRMPEAESLLGKLLNSLLGPKKKGELRKQQIEGDKLPEFEKISHYFGPSGSFVRTEADGWFISGVLLKKED